MVDLVRFLLFLVLLIVNHRNFIFPALNLFNYLVNESIVYFPSSLILAFELKNYSILTRETDEYEECSQYGVTEATQGNDGENKD